MAGTSMLTALPANTIRLIGSTQVITSVYSVIKELIENSLDAECTSVDIKLENYGLDRIEVRDNGKGICGSDVPFVARRHYTSKITSHSDLERLVSYGFRGEALASLCSVAHVSITTKTESDEVSMTYTLTSTGEAIDAKPSHLGTGTLIVASNLFKNLPVRKHYYNTNKKKKEELKKIEDLLMSFGVICPHVRLTLRHNKETVWQKSVMPDMKSAVLSVLGRQVANQLEFKKLEKRDPKLDVTMFLPKPGSDILVTSRSSSDRGFLFVNSRPVTIKEIEKLIRTYYCNSYGCDNTRHPVFVVAVTIPPNEVDVNIDPNKTKVMLHHLDAVKHGLEQVLLYLYGPLDTPRFWRQSNQETEKKSEGDNSDRNPVARALVSQYTRQPSEEKELSSLTESSASTKQIQHCRPSNKSEVSSHRGYKSSVLNHQQDGNILGNHTNEEWDLLNHENDMSDVSPHSDVLKHPNGRTLRCSGQAAQQNDVPLVDLPAGNWEIDLADIDQSQVGLEDTTNSLICASGVSTRPDLSCDSDTSRCADEAASRNKDDKICHKSKANADVQRVSKLMQMAETGKKSDSVGQDPWWIDADSDTDDILSEMMRTAVDKTSSTEAKPAASATATKEQSSKISNINTDELNNNDDTCLQFHTPCGDVLCNVPAGGDGVTAEKAKDGKLSDPGFEGSTDMSPGIEGERDDAEAWSRGLSLLINGKLVQPVSLLSPTTSHMPGKRLASPLSNDILPPEKRRSSCSQMPKPLIQGQATLYDIIGDHTVERESGFVVFLKKIWSGVVKQNQEATDEELNSIFREKWENMTESERQQYTSSISNRNTTTPCTPKDISKKVKRKLDKGRSVRDQLLSQMNKSAKKKKKVVTKPTKDIFFSLTRLQQNFERGFKQTPSQTDSRKLLIGCLRTCGAWVCSHGNDLLLMNPHRVAETILYHRLMETHQPAVDRLEKPVPLSASVIGDEKLWKTLLSLSEESWSPDPWCHIKDKRIMGNGLKIGCHKDNDSKEMMFELVGVSNQIPMLGVRDVSEILDLITNTAATTLTQSRPLKVINYLKSEAVRMVRQSPAERTKEDMAAMLSEMEELLPPGCSTCLHNKPFFHKLLDLNQVSQDDNSEPGTQLSQEENSF